MDPATLSEREPHAGGGSKRGADAPPRTLLQVTLDGVRVANLRLARVLPELLPGPALPKQVPAAVELDFHFLQPLLVLIELP